ncbi:hypothetical protein MKX03_022287 [Papaver bracteatum]|nr:hypothetical protein MKX03_022287 [Papaver bracteatum]
MAKKSSISSPFFFGLFCVALIAFMSERQYMISWNDCFEDCRYWCFTAYGSTTLGVVSGYCFNPRLFVTVCQCCTTTATSVYV